MMIDVMWLLYAYGFGVLTMGIVFVLATYRRDQLIRQGHYIVVDGTNINQEANEMTGELRIIKRNGNIDCVLKEGRYILTEAIVTIENGRIKHIDHGKWEKVN